MASHALGEKEMKIDGEYIFDAPRALVWDALQDPAVLATILPGSDGLDTVGEDEYEGALKIKVGPVQGKFKGHIQITDKVALESYNMQVDGKGAPGFVKATGGIKLTDAEDSSKTHMLYTGDAKVGGKIASVGQRLIDTSAKAIIGQSLEALNNYLKVEAAKHTVVEQAAAAGASAEEIEKKVKEEVKEYVAPTQAELASKVASQVASDLNLTPYIIGGIVLLVLIILYFLLF
ncbi:MAG: carbon monoxide dehydrogenase subunit G [Cellvibrionaceae bacterium]